MTESEGAASVIRATGLDIGQWPPGEVRLLLVSLAVLALLGMMVWRVTGPDWVGAFRAWHEARVLERRERAETELRRDEQAAYARYLARLDEEKGGRGGH